MDAFLSLDEDIPNFEVVKSIAPTIEQLSKPLLKAQEKADVVFSSPCKEFNPNKKGACDSDAEGSDIVPKKQRLKRFFEKESQMMEASNPLLKESRFDAVVLVSDWLEKIYGRIVELEKLPEQLKSTEAELKRTSDMLSNAQTHLSSVEKDLNQKLKDQEMRHSEALQTSQGKVQSLESELVKSQEELKKLKDEQANLGREFIIAYVASDTFTVNRLEEFWGKVDQFLTPRMSAYVAYLKRSSDPKAVKWDPKWLSHDRIHEFCEGWGGIPKPESKLRPIPMRPTSEQALWDLESIGLECRHKSEEEKALATSGKLPSIGVSTVSIPSAAPPSLVRRGGKEIKVDLKKKVTIAESEQVFITTTAIDPSNLETSPKDASVDGEDKA